MDHKKPEPLSPLPLGRKYCPVCGDVSYSREGIHPQCAQAQADAQRLGKQKKGKGSATNATEKTVGFLKRC